MFRHIVFFRLHEDATKAQKEAALACLRELGNNRQGILEWMITESQDTRKGIIIIENALFESEEAFNLFRSSSEHAQVAEIMGKIADWWIGDYTEEVT